MKALFLFCFLALAFAELQFTIELSSDTYQRGDDLYVNWNVNSDAKVFLLSWGTPLEGEWNSNMFQITNEQGNQAPYQGRVLKRVPPEMSDFEFIGQEGRSGSIKLSDGYHFYSAGVHSVTLKFVAKFLNGNTQLIESNTVSFTVTKPNVELLENGLLSRHSEAVGFTGCSSSQTSIVNTAITNAITASNNALNYMKQSTIRCTSTYEKWFGTYTSSRWNKIKTDFTNIYSRLNSKSFNIDCTCKQPGTYAFVYPNDPTHTIHLCPVFWDATSNKYSYNSQPGTLTHEMSHFDDVAATEDYQYGVTGCITLASDSPNVAVDNADSHEYFQESDPTC